MRTEEKKVDKTFKRETRRDLFILMEKMKSVIGVWAAENGYKMEFMINTVDPVKTLRITLTDEQNNIEAISEAVSGGAQSSS